MRKGFFYPSLAQENMLGRCDRARGAHFRSKLKELKGPLTYRTCHAFICTEITLWLSVVAGSVHDPGGGHHDVNYSATLFPCVHCRHHDGSLPAGNNSRLCIKADRNFFVSHRRAFSFTSLNLGRYGPANLPHMPWHPDA